MDFPDTYVDQLELLVYPPWYAACFMEDCRNSSVWGTYGVDHTGVCLKFKVDNSKGRPLIRLDQMCGLNSDGPVLGKIENQFHKVDYDRPLVPVDFFRSIARVPTPMLMRYWYRDENGRQSRCANPLLRSESKWRDKHWKKFNDSITRKAADWASEHEYRLIVSGELDWSPDHLRKIKYQFADLDGIIFGIRTPPDKKREISKIIEAKCRASGRDNFPFYQAYYSREEGTIEHVEMDLLRFK